MLAEVTGPRCRCRRLRCWLDGHRRICSVASGHRCPSLLWRWCQPPHPRCLGTAIRRHHRASLRRPRLNPAPCMRFGPQLSVHYDAVPSLGSGRRARICWLSLRTASQRAWHRRWAWTWRPTRSFSKTTPPHRQKRPAWCWTQSGIGPMALTKMRSWLSWQHAERHRAAGGSRLPTCASIVR